MKAAFGFIIGKYLIRTGFYLERTDWLKQSQVRINKKAALQQVIKLRYDFDFISFLVVNK
jgi:hypothetical protein